MTDDQIIGLANILHGKVKKEDTAKFIQFAKAVALLEREECADLCDDLWEDDGTAYDCAAAIRSRT